MNEEMLRAEFEKWYLENRSNETMNLKEFVYKAYQAGYKLKMKECEL